MSADHDALYSPEFFCSDGVKAAVRRGQVVIAVEDGRIIGALRFYRKKKQNIVSLYQFAVAEEHRGEGFCKRMLDMLQGSPIEALCPAGSSFNLYYEKTGWALAEAGGKFNRWVLAFDENI